MEKGLIRIVGRKNIPGKPLIYGTTKKFLEVFDLRDIESLPKLKEIKALGSEEQEKAPTPNEEGKAEATSRGGSAEAGEATPSTSED